MHVNIDQLVSFTGTVVIFGNSMQPTVVLCVDSLLSLIRRELYELKLSFLTIILSFFCLVSITNQRDVNLMLWLQEIETVQQQVRPVHDS